jgi:hypothetical protein
MLSCHFATFFRTVTTSLRAFLTVIMLVFSTLIGTSCADCGAQLTDLCGKRTITRHERSGKAAHISTVSIELNTFRHLLYIGFG